MTTPAKYVIVATYNYYGPREERRLVEDPTGRAAIFEGRAAAKEHINDYLDAGTYYLSHNESSRPDYRIRAMAGLPQYLAWQL